MRALHRPVRETLFNGLQLPVLLDEPESLGNVAGVPLELTSRSPSAWLREQFAKAFITSFGS